MNDLQGAGRVRILIVDACRDNEVIKQLSARLPATRSAVFSAWPRRLLCRMMTLKPC